MLLTLHTNSVRSLVKPPRGEPTVDLVDLPKMAREEFGLYGLNLTTDLLAGAVRARLERVREAADKSGCACLVLIEQDPLLLADADDEKALSALERLERVIHGAQILGCNSIAFRIPGRADDAALERAVEHLKEATEKADRAEINLLISSTDGLTAEPERVTSIIKKVGGFRVGTFPDFEAASKAADPVMYLRRLTPYASAVCAATMQFVEVERTADTQPAAGAEAAPADGKKSRTRTAKADPLAEAISRALREVAEQPTPPDDAAAPGADAPAPKSKGRKTKKPAGDPEAEEPPAPKGKKSKAKASPTPPAPPKDEDEGDEEDEEELKKLSAEMGLMGEEGWAELESMLEELPPPPEHRPYSLDKFIAAVVSVGYDGTVAIDYRGKGDAKKGILDSRAAIEAAIRTAQL
jgi:hypothetical protein